MATSESSVDKSRKYDRQLRLWGDHGQAALESAKVCVINAGALGTEILKNLILPGVGSYTIVDSHRTAGEDVGCNFFLDRGSIGSSRAQAATALLNELNEDTRGDYVDESLDDVLDKNPEFFLSFTVVVATAVQENSLLRLAKLLWEHSTPLVVCQTYGLIGSIRLVIQDHAVTESHPDNEHPDLRLDRPFPALQRICASYDLDAVETKDHSHIPWLIILYKFLEVYKQEHGGEHPSTYKAREELKCMIRQGIRKRDGGVPEDEENFEEAIRSINVALRPTAIPDEVQQIFNDPRCTNLAADSSPFWIIARAVKEFAATEGVLPLRGTIPDMTSDTDKYVALQRVYKEKAAEDCSAVTQRVSALKQQLGLSHQHDGASDEDIKIFCKNAAFIRTVTCSSFLKEYDGGYAEAHRIGSYLEDDSSCADAAIFYVLLRAAERFHTQYNRYPGCYEDEVETDVSLLKACVTKLLSDWGLQQSIKDEYIHEFCCYGASEIHSVAAYLSGIAAQEIIKIITRQYVPLNGMLIYNATTQIAVTLQL